MSKYVDPDFLYHKTITKLWLSHGLRMADSSLIPLNVLKYCLQLKSFFDKFETAHTKYLQPQNIKLGKYIFLQLILFLFEFSINFIL